MTAYTDGSPGQQTFTPQIDRGNRLIDATTTAATINKASCVGFFTIPATAKIVSFKAVVVSDNGTNFVTGKISPPSTTDAIFRNGSMESKGTEYADGRIEEIDDFTVTCPVGSKLQIYCSWAKTAWVANT